MEELRHLEDVVIADGLSAQERIGSFAAQIGDPYHFMVGGTEVRIEFKGQTTLEHALVRLLGVEDAPAGEPPRPSAGRSAA